MSKKTLAAVSSDSGGFYALRLKGFAGTYRGFPEAGSCVGGMAVGRFACRVDAVTGEA